MTQAYQDIRGVMIQVHGARLLLPNASISEVLSYADPEPVAGAPDWLLGRIRWRGWQLPLLSFPRFSGMGDEQGGLGSKVAVTKALHGDRSMPYFAILTQGFPRLVTVSRAGLADDGERFEHLPAGVLASVRLNDDAALIPDLDAIATALSDVLQQAA